jgi:6-phosphogluconolactonase (cycloisomerase 2 family)
MYRRGFLAATAASAAGTVLGATGVGRARAQSRGGTRLTTVDVEATGDAPADVATVRRRGRTYALVANHDADEVRSYRLDRRGNLTRVDTAAVGDTPVSVAATRRGNSASRTAS